MKVKISRLTVNLLIVSINLILSFWAADWWSWWLIVTLPMSGISAALLTMKGVVVGRKMESWMRDGKVL